MPDTKLAEFHPIVEPSDKILKSVPKDSAHLALIHGVIILIYDESAPNVPDFHFLVTFLGSRYWLPISSILNFL